MDNGNSWRGDPLAMRIRAALLALPGSQLCEYCTVITQGGHKGAKAHQAACHPEVTYGRPA